MKFVSELGGLVPKVDLTHETSIPNLFVAGDVVGIEEASSAIIEGYIVGLNASAKLGHTHQNHETLSKEYHAQLDNLRSGPFGVKTRNGLAKLRGETHAR